MNSERPTTPPGVPVGATRTALPGTAPDAVGLAVAPDVPPELRDHPRYRVLGLLGQGGMGAVYKAEHRRMGRLVALKVISPALVAGDATVRRFHQEVQAAARLRHPNIVTAHDADQAGGTHFLVMEYVDGVSLDRLVAEKGPLPIAEACDCARQAALGLQHAHEQGMVHRDVKPHNLMREADGRIKILDFGLARLARAEDTAAEAAGPAAASALTAVGSLMGTADYMAPEQAGDARSADGRADVYSLGCTLYHLLTGRVPFPGGSSLEKVMRHAMEAPVDPGQLRPGLPAGLNAVVRKMMAKEPAARFRTPAEVAAALAAYAAPRRRTRRLAAVAVVAAVAVFAGLAVYVWLARPFWPDRGGLPSIPVQQKAEGAGSSPAPKKADKPPRPPLVQRVPEKYRGAIQKGLAYLAKVQKDDGHWETDNGQFPAALTALAGMAMLMGGSTDGDGEYGDSVRKAVDWLMERAQPDGLLGSREGPNQGLGYMMGHGYAMLFLATIYGQEDDADRRRKLEQILVKAVDFTAKAQTNRGGWGYVAAAEGDNFDEGATTIMQLQGLRAARNAGIPVPKQLIDIDYLRKSTTARGGVIYSQAGGGPAERPALTAAALACMVTTGDLDSEYARKWLKFCQETLPVTQPDAKMGYDEYQQYYYAQALYILGDQGYAKLFPGAKPDEQLTWSKYRTSMFGTILKRQGDDGGWHTGSVGPVYSTACYLTILQLDNEAAPIYRR